MPKKNNSDVTFLLAVFVVFFLYAMSALMFIDYQQIAKAEKLCEKHKGLYRYYIHFGAEKFICKDGTKFLIRNK